MTLLEPLWMLWVVVPLAVLAGLLWWSVLHMEPPMPPVDIMNHPSVRRPITRSDLRYSTGPIWATTATSAIGPIFGYTAEGR